MPDSGTRSAGRWADLRLRTLSAAILAPVVILCVWTGAAAWTALVAVAALGLALEWAALCGSPAPASSRPARDISAMALAAALVLASLAAAAQHQAAALLVLLAAAPAVWSLAAHRPRRAILLLGLLYLGLPLVALAGLRGNDAGGRADVVFLILVVWASDSGAYLVGRLVGGPKLAPAISPGKTRSGAVGGLLAAMLAGALVAQSLDYQALGYPAILRAAAAAALLGIAAQAGDLLESWIKRQFGVKDSGRSIPGHGGLLDRLDGMLAAAPVAAVLAWVAGAGLAEGGRGTVLWN